MRLYVGALLGLVGCTQGSTVRGHFAYRYPDGTTVPLDLSQAEYQIYVENGDGYDRYPDQPVHGTTQGTYEIEDVPDGPFWVRVGNTFKRREQHDYSATTDVLGRPGGVTPTIATPVEIDATNLAPWANGDDLWVDCFDNATEAVPMLMSGPGSGDVEIHSSFDWANTDYVSSYGPTGLPYLMQAGDHVTVAHEASLSHTNVAGTSRLSQILTAPAPAQADGQPATVAGAFVDVPASDELAISVDTAPFLATTVNPLFSAGWSIYAVAGPGTPEGTTSGPPLFDMYMYEAPATFSKVVGYGNPFDPSWTPRLSAELQVERLYPEGEIVPYSVATEQRPLVAGSYSFMMPPAASGPTIDGHPITGTFHVPAGVALPLDARIPEGATQVLVTIWHLAGGNQWAGAMISDRTPVALPADLFQAGERYAFEITVTTQDGDATRTGSILTDEITLVR